MKVFKEEQRFTQTWLHIVMTITAILPTVIIINKEWIGNVDKSLTANKSSLGSIILIILVHLLIYKATLKTKIDEIGIHYKFIPFHFNDRKISWKVID
ncbi:hypothetical protein [Tenacibaculum sp. Bg11-29]|uniref:hypothetical protein n=1 Tax=Tenacibaculum sp. Bg11-29 TaxID=2058306 RepID=UPI001E65B47E|nr:hypothetical protein [Tenacibaculum sp. Bg11-29]